jgi:hypothetical protein
MKKDEDTSWEDFEEQVFELLHNAFQRQECAAKAAARLEKVVVDRYMQEHPEPTTAAEDVAAEYEGEASREFSADQFLSLFTSTNLLKLVRELLAAMELQELEEEITTAIIQEAFQERPSGRQVGKQRGSGEGEQFIGNDKELLLHNMREAARRSQKR